MQRAAVVSNHSSFSWMTVASCILAAFVCSSQNASWMVNAAFTTTTSSSTTCSSPAAVSSGVCGSNPLFANNNNNMQWGITNKNKRTVLQMTSDDSGAQGDEESDEDEDEGPLSKGINSVNWLPTCLGAKDAEPITSVQTGNEILPLFPLGGLVYVPNSEHVLNIFEPRYRQMYNDIMTNGSKKFVVSMSHPTEQGVFAEMGVLFELKDLKEVSKQTDDAIKFICNHKVTGRVKMRRILNPQAWKTRETYLKVEGTVYDDTVVEDAGEKKDEEVSSDIYMAVAGAAAKCSEEVELKQSFEDLVKLQHELSEDVRFTLASVDAFATSPGPGADGLWRTIQLWQNYAEQRLIGRQGDLQQDFQKKLLEFLKKTKGIKDDELPSAIGFNDLSPDLQKEVQVLQKRMAVELKPLVLESTLTMQKILEAANHKERCELLKYFIDAEFKRLSTKKMLKGMFSGDPSAASKESSANEKSASEKKAELDAAAAASQAAAEQSSSNTDPLIMDEPDAFQ